MIADEAIPTWLTLVRQAIHSVIHELRTRDELRAIIFEQKFEQLWAELKGKTRDEKLPHVIELAQELVLVTQDGLKMSYDKGSVLSLIKKVISDRQDQGKDRVISVVDPEARTGRKSDKRTIQGYKDHILIDEKSELITAVKVTPANSEDGDQRKELVSPYQKNLGVLPSEVSGDKAYWSLLNFYA